jgi:hypothetical protein
VAALTLVALVVLVLYLVLSWQGPQPGAGRPDAFDPGHTGYGPRYGPTAPGGSGAWSDGVDRGSVADGGGD